MFANIEEQIMTAMKLTLSSDGVNWLQDILEDCFDDCKSKGNKETCLLHPVVLPVHDPEGDVHRLEVSTKARISVFSSLKTCPSNTIATIFEPDRQISIKGKDGRGKHAVKIISYAERKRQARIALRTRSSGHNEMFE